MLCSGVLADSIYRVVVVCRQDELFLPGEGVGFANETCCSCSVLSEDDGIRVGRGIKIGEYMGARLLDKSGGVLTSGTDGVRVAKCLLREACVVGMILFLGGEARASVVEVCVTPFVQVAILGLPKMIQRCCLGVLGEAIQDVAHFVYLMKRVKEEGCERFWTDGTMSLAEGVWMIE